MSTQSRPPLLPREPAARVAYLALLVFVAALQFSVFAAQSIALPIMLLAWAVMLWTGKSRAEAPPIFWPLVAYGAVTLLSAAFSRDPRTSLVDCKQLVLFVIVPAVYVLAPQRRASGVLNVAISAGAISAIVGVIQYGVFAYDTLGKRPLGFLGHWMTYSGLLMLVITATVARLLYERRDRVWPALVLPALVAAVALTLTRSAWVGTCAGIGVLLLLKDFRLVAVLPLVAALAFMVAPASVAGRVYSMFNLQDETNRDRLAMLKAGAAIVRQHPLLGVGPNMVEVVYPVYRTPDAVKPAQSHLHNVPMQIAAERGLPALAVWGWFIVTAIVQLARKLRTSNRPFLAAAGLGAVAAMLTAGLFEHNFGDSEFLMLFLVMITLPFASDREEAPVTAPPASS
ncbi:MAG: O-antigen ligase family protein [Acidobacteria bacterium]|nr:O-antigen ligase family protein [Acidobacteriota bacterium]